MATTGPRALCGSSPRAWGTPLSFFLPPRPLRFIPTRVGNTLYLPLAFSVTCGSSPRAWGTHVPARQRRWCRRFIPTRVGNTRAYARSPCSLTVHPHARGEHCAGPYRAAPPMRFIPTRVGNTFTVTTGAAAGAVHPHARGEHGYTRTAPNICTGSSPRAWGTPDAGWGELRRQRFIPTRV